MKKAQELNIPNKVDKILRSLSKKVASFSEAITFNDVYNVFVAILASGLFKEFYHFVKTGKTASYILEQLFEQGGADLVKSLKNAGKEEVRAMITAVLQVPGLVYTMSKIIDFMDVIEPFLAGKNMDKFIDGEVTAEQLLKEGTFRCPECGNKVVGESNYCVNCEEYVEPKSASEQEEQLMSQVVRPLINEIESFVELSSPEVESTGMVTEISFVANGENASIVIDFGASRGIDLVIEDFEGRSRKTKNIPSNKSFEELRNEAKKLIGHFISDIS